MEEWMKTIMAALESGMEINISIRKSDIKPARIVVSCEFCEWTKDYSRADNAEKARKKHYRLCARRKEVLNRPPQWLIDQTNDVSEGEPKPNGRKKA